MSLLNKRTFATNRKRENDELKTNEKSVYTRASPAYFLSTKEASAYVYVYRKNVKISN